MQRPSTITLALLGGVVALLVLLFVLRGGGANPDRLDDVTTATNAAAASTKACTGARVYDSLKHQLFDRAVQLRASDAGAYAQIANVAVARMENPALEDESNGAAMCSGSLSIDLPPGIAASGGRRSLMGDVDYSVAADGTVAIRNGDSLINGLASLSRSGNGMSTPLAQTPAPAPPAQPSDDQAIAAPQPQVQPQAPVPAIPSARPSFSCAKARSRSEIAVCADAGLAALDRNMAAQYGRAIVDATPQQRALLQQTRDRFLGYRDRCPDSRCIGDTYAGRMREISDIMEGRWRPTR